MIADAGPLMALAASPEADDWYGLWHSALLRSTDRGQSWQPLLEIRAAGRSAFTAMALSADGCCLLAGGPGSIICSEDGGQRWSESRLAAPLPAPTMLAFSPDFARDRLALCATLEDGVLRSSDGGHNWERWNFGLLDQQVYCISFADTGRVYAGTASGVFESRSDGRSWQETGFHMEAAPVISLAISSTFSADQTLYVGTENQGLWCSRDGGPTWERLAESEIQGAVNAVVTQYDMVLALQPDRLLQLRDTAVIAHMLPEGSEALCALSLQESQDILIGLANGQTLSLALTL